MNKINFRENECTSWPFNLDNRQDYAWYDTCFSKSECEKIIEIGKSIKHKQAEIYKDDKLIVDKNFRDTNICWLNPNDNLNWAYQRITDIVMDLNERFFNFDLYGISESLQFTNYKAPSGKYKKHIDSSYNNLIRKLSISIQLSKVEEYEGGDLILYRDANGEVMRKEQGTLIIFPSFVLHEVTEVTKGERNSLVGWITGKQFK